jgi:hypothetical protein
VGKCGHKGSRRRKKEKRKWGMVSNKHILMGREKRFPALKVPRQCPLGLLVEVRLREGKALGSEEGKRLRKWTLL